MSRTSGMFYPTPPDDLSTIKDDAWIGTQAIPGYDPLVHYGDIRDPDKESSPIATRIPDRLIAAATLLIGPRSSGKLYRTQSEFTRGAYYHNTWRGAHILGYPEVIKELKDMQLKEKNRLRDIRRQEESTRAAAIVEAADKYLLSESYGMLQEYLDTEEERAELMHTDHRAAVLRAIGNQRTLLADALSKKSRAQ